MTSFTEDEDFGAQLRSARALLRVTQGELARAARVSVATLNEIESGKARARHNTRAALTNCMTDAGVLFEREMGDEQGQLFGVLLHRSVRPFHLTDSVQSLLAPDALFSPLALLFYIASTGKDAHRSDSTDELFLGVEVEFAHRRVLLDRAGFDFSPLRVARLGRFLLSAFSLYGDRIFCSEPLRLATLKQSTAEASITLARCERREMYDPFPLLFALEAAMKAASANQKANSQAPFGGSLQDIIKQREHPLARVKELIEAARETTTQESTIQESMPEESITQESMPEESMPEESMPRESAPQESTS